MSGKFSFKQKEEFARGQRSLRFSSGLLQPFCLKSNETRRQIAEQYLASHTPAIDLPDGSVLVVTKKAAYVRGGGKNFDITKDPHIEICLKDGSVIKIDTRSADVLTETGEKLAPCHDANAVINAALELLQDDKFAELAKRKDDNAQSMARYKVHLSEVCAANNIWSEKKMHNGKELPMHDQDNDIKYVERVYFAVPRLQDRVAKVVSEYLGALQNMEKETPLKKRNGKAKRLKRAENKKGVLPLFDKIEDNNLTALN